MSTIDSYFVTTNSCFSTVLIQRLNCKSYEQNKGSLRAVCALENENKNCIAKQRSERNV